MSSSNNYVRELKQEAENYGFSISYTKSRHIRLTHPAVPTSIFASGTPSDHRVLVNVVAKMKRMLRKYNLDQKAG